DSNPPPSKSKSKKDKEKKTYVHKVRADNADPDSPQKFKRGPSNFKPRKKTSTSGIPPSKDNSHHAVRIITPHPHKPHTMNLSPATLSPGQTTPNKAQGQGPMPVYTQYAVVQMIRKLPYKGLVKPTEAVLLRSY